MHDFANNAQARSDFIDKATCCSLEQFKKMLKEEHLAPETWADLLYVFDEKIYYPKLKLLSIHLARELLQRPVLPSTLSRQEEYTWGQLCSRIMQYTRQGGSELLGVLTQALFDQPQQEAVDALLAEFYTGQEDQLLSIIHHPKFKECGLSIIPEKHLSSIAAVDGVVWWGSRMSNTMQEYIDQVITPANQVNALLICMFKSAQEGRDHLDLNDQLVDFWSEFSVNKDLSWWKEVDQVFQALHENHKSKLKQQAPRWYAMYEKQMLLHEVDTSNQPNAIKPKL